MTSTLLIYPYFKPRGDRSVFRFPPLGIGYIAASLLEAGHEVHILDCTFIDRRQALSTITTLKAEVVGIYCMVTMLEDCLWFAKNLRHSCGLLVAGGPLPTCNPLPFMQYFDVVVRGEGEQTMQELITAYRQGTDLSSVAGIVYRKQTPSPAVDDDPYVFTAERIFTKDLNRIPFPSRQLLPNRAYIQYGKKKYGYSITTIMSSRGCPFRCEFCSNVVFGGTYRERSPRNVVDEIELALGLGYDRISFADDVFTLNQTRVIKICQEIQRRGLKFNWECLGRVDTIDYSTALEMKSSGCTRVYFGIESGNDQILKLMNKKITTEQARRAVENTHRAGLEVGAFFIICYPGETNETILDTIRFATSLPLDYLGLTMPYPLPGTGLYTRVKDKIDRPWRQGNRLLGDQTLIFKNDFSETKMWFGILKGHTQFKIKRIFGKSLPFLLGFFEKITDTIFTYLR